MNFWKTSFYTALATLASLSSTFIVAKFIAIFAGAAAFGLFGQFISFIAILQIASGGIVQTGVVKYIAEYKDCLKEKDEIISTATSLVSIFSILSGIVVAFFSKELSRIILGSSSYYWLFICFGFTLYGYVMNQLIKSILNGLNRMKEYALFSILSSIISILIIPILAYLYKTNGVLLGFVLGQLILFIVVLFFARLTEIRLYLFKLNLRNIWTKKLLLFSIISVVSTLTLPLAQILLRNYIAEHSSWTEVGYWEGMLKISDAYLLLIITVISTYALPKYSLINCNKKLRKEVFYLLKIIIPIIIALATIIYLLRDFVIVILFSKSFMPMESLFHFQLLGDVVKIASWIISYTFVAKAKIKIFILLEIGFVFLFLFLSILFFNIFGLYGLTIGFFINYVIYFMVCFCIFMIKTRV